MNIYIYIKQVSLNATVEIYAATAKGAFMSLMCSLYIHILCIH